MNLIVAIGKNNEMGYKNDMPWSRGLKGDLKHFRKVTTNNIIVMGRKTFETLGKPLKDRINIVLTRDKNYKADGCYVINEIEQLNEISKKHKEKEVFIIGGSEIYKLFIENNLINKYYITEVEGEFNADTYFPDLIKNLNYKRELEKINIDEENKYNAIIKLYEI